MKHIIYSLLGFLLLSCTGRQQPREQFIADNDSLATAVSAKDSIINEVFASLNEIAANLNAIKEREHLITSYVGNAELKREPSAQIKQDISELDELVVKNHKTIRRLEDNIVALRKSEMRIPNLETLISQLRARIDEKDMEIQTLKKQMDNMSRQVGDLTTQVSGLNERNAYLEQDIISANDVMNNAYYIVGSQKELLKKGIIYKSGFIGKTLKINENHNLFDFTKVDIRKFDEIILGKQNVRIISVHPDNSYQMVMKDKNTTSSIVILDRTRFWEYSKVLVIVYK